MQNLRVNCNNGQPTLTKTFKIISHQGKASHNHSETSLHIHKDGYNQTKTKKQTKTNTNKKGK